MGGIAQETHAALFLIPRSHDSINNTLCAHSTLRSGLKTSKTALAGWPSQREKEPQSLLALETCVSLMLVVGNCEEQTQRNRGTTPKLGGRPFGLGNWWECNENVATIE